MDFPLALVTGGNRGIGRAIAAQLHHDGYALLLVARDEVRLRQVAAELHAPGRPPIHTAAVDLAAPGASERVLAAVGQRSVDVLVNNAGVAPSDRFEATDDRTLRTVLTLHVEVPFALTRAVLPGMKASARGAVVQVASTAGLRGFPFTAAYAAAKGGLLGMTRALIAELGLGAAPLRAFAVCPGFVDTDLTRGAATKVAARGKQSATDALAKMGQMNALGRLLAPDEVARFVGRLLRERPPSGIFDLDRDPPARVD